MARRLTIGRRTWVLGAFAMVGWVATLVVMWARRTAQASCLTSLHRDLNDRKAFSAVPATPTWRDWTEGETRSALAGVEPGDCSDDWWKRDVSIRTRRSADGQVDAWLWRTSDPRVASGSARE
jgi:hypothetical protein